MDSLEDRQREMRERNTRLRIKENRQQCALSPLEPATENTSSEVLRLKKNIAELQKQVSALQLENSRLRAQKTIVVERSRGDSVKEQQHNFFKYSNARRY